MSNTPRTDAARQDEHDPYMAVASECAKLEQELNAANQRIKLLEAVTNDPHALWTNWLRGNVKLPVGIGDVREYQDRVKRLEQAGDALEYAYVISESGEDPNGFEKLLIAHRKWNTAKEAKL